MPSSLCQPSRCPFAPASAGHVDPATPSPPLPPPTTCMSVVARVSESCMQYHFAGTQWASLTGSSVARKTAQETPHPHHVEVDASQAWFRKQEQVGRLHPQALSALQYEQETKRCMGRNLGPRVCTEWAIGWTIEVQCQSIAARLALPYSITTSCKQSRWPPKR